MSAPEFSPAAVNGVRAAVRAALRFEADHSPGWRWDSSLDPIGFLSAVRRHRVQQVLLQASEALLLPEEVVDALSSDVGRDRSTALIQCAELLRAGRALDLAGVSWLAVKGPALAVQTCGDFSARGGGDLDFLVSRGDVARARGALAAAGWAPSPELPTPGESWAWRHLLDSYIEISMTSSTSRVDLHWRLACAPGALPGFGELWSRRTHVSIGGCDVPTLSPPDALYHSCNHAARDDWAWLRSLVDIHRLLRDPIVGCSPSSRSVVKTLAVVSDVIGLPDTASHQLPGQRRTLARARAQQEAVHDHVLTKDRPVKAHLTLIRRTARGSTGARDLAVVVKRFLLLPKATRDIQDRRAITAIPKTLLKQLRAENRATKHWQLRQPDSAGPP